MENKERQGPLMSIKEVEREGNRIYCSRIGGGEEIWQNSEKAKKLLRDLRNKEPIFGLVYNPLLLDSQNSDIIEWEEFEMRVPGAGNGINQSIRFPLVESRNEKSSNENNMRYLIAPKRHMKIIGDQFFAKQNRINQDKLSSAIEVEGQEMIIECYRRNRRI